MGCCWGLRFVFGCARLVVCSFPRFGCFALLASRCLGGVACFVRLRISSWFGGSGWRIRVSGVRFCRGGFRGPRRVCSARVHVHLHATCAAGRVRAHTSSTSPPRGNKVDALPRAARRHRLGEIANLGCPPRICTNLTQIVILVYQIVVCY